MPSPNRYIAFLRAINVGGHTVKMDQLRGHFQELGFSDVESFIASGNIIFTTPESDPFALAAEIERHLLKSLGFAVATFLRTPAQVADIAAFEPFPVLHGESEDHALSVAFLSHAPSAAGRERLATFRTDVDDFRVHRREVYWSCRVKVSESRFSGAVLEKALGQPATMRNMTTVRKLARRYPPDG